MQYLSFADIGTSLAHHWPVWLVTITLVVAAVIDGIQLKVPNWITFPMVMSGWAYSVVFAHSLGMVWWEALGWSLFGTAVGLALLLPAYAVGGMGAGDVKLLAGIGAWVYGEHVFYAFCLSALIGAVIAVVMVLVRRGWQKHFSQFKMIANEMMTLRDPTTLATIAAGRKSSMLLLPYGIPIAIGTITYFFWMGMLI